MPPDPLRSWYIRYSTFAPVAQTVHVRHLKHCIRYFQMPPKTLLNLEGFLSLSHLQNASVGPLWSFNYQDRNDRFPTLSYSSNNEIHILPEACERYPPVLPLPPVLCSKKQSCTARNTGKNA